MHLDITPLILTYNEAPNIERVLNALDWANQIILIDSYSTDQTLKIAQSFSAVQIYQRQFDTHAHQWNYGLEKVNTDWVLSLDADYVLSLQLIEQIKNLSRSSTDSYFIPFKYCVFGQPLRGTILPPREALFRKAVATYIDDGHTQLLVVEGQSSHLSQPIFHDDRKPLSRWLWAQDRYMQLEVKKLLNTSNTDLSFGDRIRKTKVLAPFIVLLYCLIFKGGILDGWGGLYYAFQRMLAETLLSIHLIKSDASS